MLRGAVFGLGLAACSFRHGEAPGDGAALDAASHDARPPGDGHADGSLDGGPTGLVAWYQMETLSNQQALDSSGNGHTGTCATTACPLVEPSQVGQGYLFSTGDRIDVAAEGGLASMTGFTVAFWATLDAAIAGHACVVNKGLGGGTNNSWQFCFAPPDATMYYWTSDGTNVDILTSPTAIPIGQWHHVAITWDGSTKQVWFDGTSDVSNTNHQVAWDARDLTLGADVDNPTTGDSVNDLPGALDDVRIYDHALTAQQIFALAH